jgi:hypothetical protein
MMILLMPMRTFIGKLFVSIRDNKHKKKSAKEDNRIEYTSISLNLSSKSPNVTLTQCRSSRNTRNRDERATSKKKEEPNQSIELEKPICSSSTIQTI